MLVVWDSGNMKYRLVIPDYSCSTVFRTYCGIPGTWNGGFNKISQLTITFVFIIVKFLICWFNISGTYFSIIISWMMFGRIIGQVACPIFPEHKELSLFYTISDPIETHVNGTWEALFCGTVCCAYCWWILDTVVVPGWGWSISINLVWIGTDF